MYFYFKLFKAWTYVLPLQISLDFVLSNFFFMRPNLYLIVKIFLKFRCFFLIFSQGNHLHFLHEIIFFLLLHFFSIPFILFYFFTFYSYNLDSPGLLRFNYTSPSLSIIFFPLTEALLFQVNFTFSALSLSNTQSSLTLKSIFPLASFVFLVFK